MIRKMVLFLLSVGATALLVAGVVSYWKGIPDDAILISVIQPRLTVQTALTRGILHVVMAGPASQPGSKTTERKFGPFYVRREELGFTTATGFGVPFWFLCGVMFTGPVIGCLRGPLRRRSRRRRGECPVCGYSLRGLPVPRCPECGTTAQGLVDAGTCATTDTIPRDGPGARDQACRSA
jgi:hypothetical protein